MLHQGEVEAKEVEDKQDVSSYEALAIQFAEAGERDTAIAYFEHVIALLEQNDHIDNLLLYHHKASEIDKRAKYYAQEREWDKAIPFFEYTIALQEKITRDENEEDCRILALDHNQLSLAYYSIRLYSEALDHTLRAIDIRHAIHVNEDDERALAFDYNNAGNICYALKDFSQAIHYYVIAIKHLQKNIPEFSDVDFINSSMYYNNLGNAYVALDDLEGALQNYQEAVLFQSRLQDANHALELYQNNVEFTKMKIQCQALQYQLAAEKEEKQELQVQLGVTQFAATVLKDENRALLNNNQHLQQENAKMKKETDDSESKVSICDVSIFNSIQIDTDTKELYEGWTFVENDPAIPDSPSPQRK